MEILEDLIRSDGDIFPEAYYFQANNYANFLEWVKKALELVIQYLQTWTRCDFSDEAESWSKVNIEMK